MNGKSREVVMQELKASSQPASLGPFKIFDGNIPSNTFLFKKLDPFSLGQLIALYEHKIFVQGVIWNVFSFDQWGVELGKQLALPILNELKSDVSSEHDSSTRGLIDTFKTWKN